jgi:fused signal recognition particle receptor
LNLRKKLKKSRDALSRKLVLVFGHGVDENTLEAAEEVLLTADLGWELTELVLDRFRDEYKLNGDAGWKSVLVSVLQGLVPEYTSWEPDAEPAVTLVVGVNGAGKTTTIARLAQRIAAGGETVLMGCADTYRAAASEQLALWGDRLGIPVYTSVEGTDPGAVTFDSVKRAIAEKFNHVIIDTAGRLPTQKGLMDELSKVYRVVGKAMQGAPHRVILVLDGTVGQNALAQARQFTEFIPVTDLVITKLDGTAKGGSVFAMARELSLPIRYIGVGEGADDLVAFNGKAFVEAIVGGDD